MKECKMIFDKLAINDPTALIFGRAPKPVTTRRGLIIGGGTVYPELNFTLPTMEIRKETIPEIRTHYEEIVSEALQRAYELQTNGLVFEFETLLEMTLDPKLGVMLVKAMNDICEDWYVKKGIKSEIRLNPERYPGLRQAAAHADPAGIWAEMLELFEQGGIAGGDLLSIESTGGKEIHDDALLMCDIKQAMFALTVLGTRDMRYLWKNIVGIAKKQERSRVEIPPAASETPRWS